MYYFGSSKNEEEQVLSRTSSGGVTINDVLGHIQQEDLPFGGVGPSGIGSYHGEEGFKTFSNAKAVYKQIGSRFDRLLSAIRPPYKDDIEKVLKQINITLILKNILNHLVIYLNQLVNINQVTL